MDPSESAITEQLNEFHGAVNVDSPGLIHTSMSRNTVRGCDLPLASAYLVNLRTEASHDCPARRSLGAARSSTWPRIIRQRDEPCIHNESEAMQALVLPDIVEMVVAWWVDPPPGALDAPAPVTCVSSRVAACGS